MQFTITLLFSSLADSAVWSVCWNHFHCSGFFCNDFLENRELSSLHLSIFFPLVILPTLRRGITNCGLIPSALSYSYVSTHTHTRTHTHTQLKVCRWGIETRELQDSGCLADTEGWEGNKATETLFHSLSLALMQPHTHTYTHIHTHTHTHTHKWEHDHWNLKWILHECAWQQRVSLIHSLFCDCTLLLVTLITKGVTTL